MKTFPLVISTPEGDLFRDNAVRLTLRGVAGDLAVMAGHIPFITIVKECDFTINLETDETKKMHTSGGTLTVAQDKVTLLSGYVELINQ